jgi:hypothetical protein
MNPSIRQCGTALLFAAALLGSASAEVVASLAPYSAASFGVQSDASVTVLPQAFVAPPDTVVEAIRWFGFHSVDSGGTAYDQFVVSLGGVVQSGTLMRLSVLDISGVFLYDEYILDIPDTALLANSLSIVNDSPDVEWFWQSALAVGSADSPSAEDRAFMLIGRQETPGAGTAPEPSSLALAVAALALCGLGRRAQSPR